VVLELGNGRPAKKILFDKPELPEINAIKEELHAFALSIIIDEVPPVPLEAGAMALEVAHQIIEKIKINSPLISDNNI
jgi:hypothetical protein